MISYHTSKRNRGFTLIELLIAVALGALLLAAIYGTFFVVTNSARSAQAEAARYIELGRFLDRFSLDVHSAYLDNNDANSVFLGDQKGLSSVVTFNIFSYPVIKTGFPASDRMGVSYYTEEGRDGLKVFREVRNPFTGVKTRVAALEGVGRFEVDYFNGATWSKAWDSGLESGLPAAVRAVVVLKSGRSFSALARTMINTK